MDEMKTTHGGAGFFHIDRRIWKILCGLDDINVAVAYLTIAAGTGKGNRFSRWSALAIQNYTGLAWKRGKPAIAKLVSLGFIILAPSSTVPRPAYQLQLFESVYEAALERLNDWDKGAISTGSTYRHPKPERADLDGLAMLGLLWQHGSSFAVDAPKRDPQEDFIWLPNVLVTGTKVGEASPVKRLRQLRNLDALRLLVDLHSVQSLPDDGGVSRCVLQGLYERKAYGSYGNRTVWGFKQKTANAYPSQESTEFFWQRREPGQSSIWQALGASTKLGLVSPVPHLVENEDQGSEPIIGVGWNGLGEPLEHAVAIAAHDAARRLLPEVILNYKVSEESVLVPVWSTMPNVAMADIYRLRYRPQTEATARWLRQMTESATAWIADYDQVEERFTELDEVFG